MSIDRDLSRLAEISQQSSVLAGVEYGWRIAASLAKMIDVRQTLRTDV